MDFNYDQKKKRKPSVDVSSMVYGKVPPQAKELEEAVLGAVMLDRTAFDLVAEIIKPEAFYVDAHQRTFRAFKRLVDKQQPIDLLTVVEELKRTEELDMVGGPYYLTKLTNSVVSSANIETHARILLEKFIQRELIRISGEIIGDAYEDSIDVFDLMDDKDKKFEELNSTIQDAGSSSLQTLGIGIIQDFRTRVMNARDGVQNPNDIFTGFKAWDEINGPLFCGGVYVVAARPGMGKSAHATQLVVNTACNSDIGLLNGEMTNRQAMIRIGCNILQLSNDLYKKPKHLVTDEELYLQEKSIEEAMKLRLLIEDTKHIEKARARMRHWVKVLGVKLIIGDLLHVFRVPKPLQRLPRTEQINYLFDEFVESAKELEVPIILYAHLNREVEKRNQGVVKPPTMSDLKGSGNIEDFAFQISFLHRPEYYGVVQDEGGHSTKGLCFQNIVKHRDGELGSIKHRFYPQYSRWEPWDDDITDFKIPIYTTPGLVGNGLIQRDTKPSLGTFDHVDPIDLTDPDLPF